MTGFVVFGSILALLITVIIWSAVRAGSDASSALGPEERRDAAVEALRELEFEFSTGKVSEEEYRQLKGRIEREALAARDASESSRSAPASCAGCGAPREGEASFCSACGQAFV